MSVADAPADHRDRQRLVLRLAELGIPTTDATAQRHVCAVWTNGRALTRSALTKRDAGTLYARLQTMTREELVAVLARPLPGAGPATEPGPVPEETPEEAPAVDPAVCLASWEEQTDDVAPATRSASPPHGGTCPCDACNPDPPEEEHVPEPDPAPAGSVAPAVPLVAPLPVASPPSAEPAPELVVTCEPPCRTPEEIAAAAEAAVVRFRERAAAGIVPEPPPLGSIPPRVPLTLPPRPDRYCLTGCYCRTCEQYPAQAEAAERAYRQELTAARNKDLRR